MTERYLRRVAVGILLTKDDKVFLLRRFNTGWRDGYYTFPCGHVERDETALEGIVRETKEEAGVDVARRDLKLVHVIQRKNLEGDEYIDLNFLAENWHGDPYVAEPEKANDGGWFPVDALPEKTLKYVAQVIRCWKQGVLYSEIGWHNEGE